jgi:hypothetical protein
VKNKHAVIAKSFENLSMFNDPVDTKEPLNDMDLNDLESLSQQQVTAN